MRISFFVSANKMNQNVATSSLIYSKVSHYGLQYIYLKGETTEPKTGQWSLWGSFTET